MSRTLNIVGRGEGRERERARNSSQVAKGAKGGAKEEWLTQVWINTGKNFWKKGGPALGQESSG